MKAFNENEITAIQAALEMMLGAISAQEKDMTRFSAVRITIESIIDEFQKAEIDDLPMKYTNGELMTLVMLYSHIAKYYRFIMDTVFDALFRHIKEE